MKNAFASILDRYQSVSSFLYTTEILVWVLYGMALIIDNSIEQAEGRLYFYFILYFEWNVNLIERQKASYTKLWHNFA